MKATQAALQRAKYLHCPEDTQASRAAALALASFRFSRRAEAELLSIGAYTLRTWGEEQTNRYIDDLESCCQMLADTQQWAW